MSVCGELYSLRQTRSSSQRGDIVPDETNILRDGSLVDLCGATLLWRSVEGLANAPVIFFFLRFFKSNFVQLLSI